MNEKEPKEEHFETPPDAPTLPGGNKVVGRYRILKAIGHGGMGQVFYAQDVELQRPVALKVIRPHLADNPEVIARFRREARAAARLNHPGIVQIYEFGQDEAGTPFFAMEYVEGRSLQDFLRERGQLKIEEALRVTLSLAKTLEYAHKNDVIHRDIKPANILVSKEGRIKILDFGLARCLEADSSLTQSGSIIGSPHYMSPEQGKGEKADHRSDIYSLGVTLFHMLTGSVPFEADSPLAVMLHHVQTPMPRSEKLSAMLGGRVEELLERLMAKKPENRFQDYADLRGAVHALLQKQLGESVTVAAPPPGAPAANSSNSAQTPPPLEAESGSPSPWQTPTMGDMPLPDGASNSWQGASGSQTPIIIQQKRTWLWPMLTGVLVTLLVLLVLVNMKNRNRAVPQSRTPQAANIRDGQGPNRSAPDGPHEQLAQLLPTRDEMAAQIADDLEQSAGFATGARKAEIARAFVTLDFPAARTILKQIEKRLENQPDSVENAMAKGHIAELSERARDAAVLQTRAERKLRTMDEPVRIYNALDNDFLEILECSLNALTVAGDGGEEKIGWTEVHPAVMLCLGALAFGPESSDGEKEQLLELAGLYRIDLGVLNQVMVTPQLDFEKFFESTEITPVLVKRITEHIIEEQGPMAGDVAPRIAAAVADLDFEEATRIAREELEQKASRATTPEMTEYVRSLRDLSEGLARLSEMKRGIMEYINKQDEPVILLNVQPRGRMVIESANREGYQVQSGGKVETVAWAEAGPSVLVRLAVKVYGRASTEDQRKTIQILAEIFGLKQRTSNTVLPRRELRNKR